MKPTWRPRPRRQAEMLAASNGEEYLEKYRLVTMDPDKMIVTLQEVGGLSPWAELRADAATKTLFVRASAEDQSKIKKLVGQLDGTGRQFHVIQLRRLPADAVAQTIHTLMVGQEDEQQSSILQALQGGGGRGGRGGNARGGRGGCAVAVVAVVAAMPSRASSSKCSTR